jgi:uncharacterized protein (DUF427 family)
MKAIWNDKIIAESDDTVPDAAWYYDSPMPAAMAIKGRVAFWRGVQIVDS